MVSQFATDAEALTRAFCHVMAGTDITPAMQAAILPHWIDSSQSGNPQRELKALDPLLQERWAWPLFNEWFGIFEALGRWPYMWQQVGIADGEIEAGRLTILAHTLTMTGYRVRDVKAGKSSFLASRGWEFRSIGCPVEDEIAASMKQSVHLDMWETWPPFFPGDRSSIMALPRSNLAR